jgi:hypothetical protein
MAQSEGASIRTINQSLPSLPKIKTKPVNDVDSLEEEKTSSDDVAGCVTPTSEEHRIKPLTECPPAPHKPPPPKRKRVEKTPNVRQLVPHNLSVVFASLPPKKRLRAGSHLIY